MPAYKLLRIVLLSALASFSSYGSPAEKDPSLKIDEAMRLAVARFDAADKIARILKVEATLFEKGDKPTIQFRGDSVEVPNLLIRRYWLITFRYVPMDYPKPVDAVVIVDVDTLELLP